MMLMLWLERGMKLHEQPHASLPLPLPFPPALSPPVCRPFDPPHLPAACQTCVHGCFPAAARTCSRHPRLHLGHPLSTSRTSLICLFNSARPPTHNTSLQCHTPAPTMLVHAPQECTSSPRSRRSSSRTMLQSAPCRGAPLTCTSRGWILRSYAGATWARRACSRCSRTCATAGARTSAGCRRLATPRTPLLSPTPCRRMWRPPTRSWQI